MIVFQLAAGNIGYRMFGKGFKMNSYKNMNPAGIICGQIDTFVHCRRTVD
ncbi:hypothetical protein [Bacillus sp. MUM 116]|nr:hypothetical protein [Bacillus sp. MUM 116]